jgi:hypothetical protein
MTFRRFVQSFRSRGKLTQCYDLVAVLEFTCRFQSDESISGGRFPTSGHRGQAGVPNEDIQGRHIDGDVNCVRVRVLLRSAATPLRPYGLLIDVR